jgi:ribosome recycling factor
MMSYIYLSRIIQATKNKLTHHPLLDAMAVARCHLRGNDGISTLPSNSKIQLRMMSNHGAKKGLHLQHLAEMANQKEHDAAVARREKKKEKTAARKGGKKGGGAVIQQQDVDDEFEKDKNKLQSKNDDDNWHELEDDEDEEETHDTTVLPNPNEVKTKMMKHVDNFRNYLKSIRGGGPPSVEMFDDVMVRDAYGIGTGDVSVKALAQIVMTTPTLATATCFDPATSKAVVIAIRDTLELNPQAEEGTGTIKIPIPRISMEVRQQMISTIHKRAENYRVRIRNHRRTVLDIVKQGVAGKLDGVSKDDAFRIQQEIETMTDIVIKELNKLSEKKESEILSVQ